MKQKLIEIGYNPDTLPLPGGNYVSVRKTGALAYVAIQFPIREGQFYFQGRLGADLTTEDGYAAARMCALNVLFQMENKIGLEHIATLNHFDFYYQAADHWDDAPHIANGASDLLVEMLGEAGLHSRAILGVAQLARNFSVGITAVFSLKA